MNWLDFTVKWSGSSRDRKFNQISTLEGIFSPMSWMHARNLTKLFTVTHYQVHMTLMTCWRSGGQRSRSDKTFSRNALLWRRHDTNRRFNVKDRLIVNITAEFVCNQNSVNVFRLIFSVLTAAVYVSALCVWRILGFVPVSVTARFPCVFLSE